MQKADLNNPSERKKLVVAAVLGVVALVFLWWAFVGFGGSSNNRPSQKQVAAAPPLSNPRVGPVDLSRAQTPPAVGDLLAQLQPVAYQSGSTTAAEPKRNIFAFYEPPPKSAQSGSTPPPAPTPTPPVLLTTVAPSSVYARSSDFTLDVSGDKFSPSLRIFVDSRELPTRFVSPQQLSTTVPAAMIATPGQRQVVVRSPDRKLYSNEAGFSVTPPPTPNYNYIGIIGNKHYVDIALVQDRNNKEILNVQRGDVLSGRFRVTSISEKELVLTDTNLKIKHALAMTNDGEKGLGPLARPTPKVDAEDDEP